MRVEFSKRNGLKIIRWTPDPLPDNLENAYLNECGAPPEVIEMANQLMGGKVQTAQQFREGLKNHA